MRDQIMPERSHTTRRPENRSTVATSGDESYAVTAYISHTTIDAANAYELSEWWKLLLGYEDIPGDPNKPGHEECMIQDPETGHQLLFIEVPDAKSVKNRLHLDLRPRSNSRDEEVEWLLSIGATKVADLRGKYGPGSGWVVFADPEGNEFCMLRSDAERAADDQPIPS
ncbi:MAG TPA: VOC family protein [Nocardioides sp.]